MNCSLLHAFQADVRLDEFHRPVGARRHRLGGGAGEPVDHRAARDQAKEERRVQQRQLVEVRRQVGRERHDDREDHRRRPDDGGTDEHRLRRGLERVAGTVVFFQQLLRAIEAHVESVVALQRCRDPGDLLDHRKLEDRLRVVGDRTHPQEAERDEAEREHRRRVHERGLLRADRAHVIGNGHQRDDAQSEPVGAEIAGDEP